jgi:hypothetical protein
MAPTTSPVISPAVYHPEHGLTTSSTPSFWRIQRVAPKVSVSPNPAEKSLRLPRNDRPLGSMNWIGLLLA